MTQTKNHNLIKYDSGIYEFYLPIVATGISECVARGKYVRFMDRLTAIRAEIDTEIKKLREERFKAPSGAV